MNLASNRKSERINTLYSLLEIVNIEDKKLITIPHNILMPSKYILDELTDNHIAGIIDGDGSFYVSFQTDGDIKTGFNITNDKTSKVLLEKIQSRLSNIGSIHVGSKNELVYTVKGINQITETLIPFMDKNPIFSEKSSHYNKFRFISLMLKNNYPLTLENKLQIVEMAYTMNKGGKRRLMTKLEYIKLLKKLS